MISCAGLLTLGGVSATAVVAPITTLAGSNGQELQMYDDMGWTGVCFDGTNQNGSHIYACGGATANTWTQYNGYWWIGWTWYGPSANYTTVYVPQNQGNNHTCFYASNASSFACN
jgi:hypothetical protein